MNSEFKVTRYRNIFLATAISSGLIAFQAAGQTNNLDCSDSYGTVPTDCEELNSTTAVDMLAEPNTEFDRGRIDNDSGFILAIDGEPIDGDQRLEDAIRKTDIALEKADVQVKFDGFDVKPRLDLSIQRNARGTSGQNGLILRSHLNYPAFVKRGELRIFEVTATGQKVLKGVVPITPNGTANLTAPAGENLHVVHRVYDGRGRYDETVAVPLNANNNRGLSNAHEEGTDATAQRRIPIYGGAVTVFSDNMPSGTVLRTLGESVQPTSGNRAVIQRILPAGVYDIDVAVQGAGGQQFSREIEIPASDWFYAGLADVTIGQRRGPSGNETFQTGRLGFYVKGKTQSGYEITASADTREDDLGDLLRNLDEKDPRSVLQRIDPDDLYPVYGDDSTSYDDTPTSGKLYVKVEKDGNYALWGDYKGRLNGNEYVRNERSLYGAQGVWQSQAQSTDGEARVSAQLYASQPDTLPARDVLQGTGGSIYFLQRQDLNIGSETISVEVRDKITGRIMDRTILVRDVDYSINYIQGTIVLKQPLASSTNTGVVTSTAAQSQTVNLVAQYEYSPTLSSADGYSYGGRVEGWVTDNLRVGLSAMSENTGPANQDTVGADILMNLGDNSHARLDMARTSGPGFGSSLSTDGGLIINNSTTANGDGTAYRAEVQADFADMGLSVEGNLTAYVEHRGEGFATLDHQVTAATGDEDLWGVSGRGRLSTGMTWAASHDDYKAGNGNYQRTTQIELGFQGTGRVSFELGADYLESNDGTTRGSRTDIGGRVTYQQREDREYYLFAQGTVSNSGLSDNNKVGVGANVQLTENWKGEAEIYHSTEGLGGRALFTYAEDENDSYYFGYEREAGRTLGNSVLQGNDMGRVLVGGKRQVNNKTSVFAENTYDLFGVHRSLTSTYGVSYSPDETITYDVAAEIGRIDDSVDGDFDRWAVSLGTLYQANNLTAQGKIEYRRERGVTSGVNRDADTILLSGTARYEINDRSRLLVNVDAAHTDTDQSSVLNGTLADVTIGYAVRPIANDKFNLLFKYRYLYDLYGQQIDGTAGTGARQKSHVLSVDASYDLNQHWTVGGKIGARLAETSPDATTAFSQNNAMLGVVNARYHMVHNWDALLEARMLKSDGAGTTQVSVLGAVYRHVGNNLKIGVGYNFGKFSDDLTNLSSNERGPFINLIAKY